MERNRVFREWASSTLHKTLLKAPLKLQRCAEQHKTVCLGRALEITHFSEGGRAQTPCQRQLCVSAFPAPEKHCAAGQGRFCRHSQVEVQRGKKTQKTPQKQPKKGGKKIKRRKKRCFNTCLSVPVSFFPPCLLWPAFGQVHSPGSLGTHPEDGNWGISRF